EIRQGDQPASPGGPTTAVGAGASDRGRCVRACGPDSGGEEQGDYRDPMVVEALLVGLSTVADPGLGLGTAALPGVQQDRRGVADRTVNRGLVPDTPSRIEC